MRLRAALIVVSLLLVGLYYRWGAHAAGVDFQWDGHAGGYYNLLAQGFAAGHLYLPVSPSPELLSKTNPWDPAVDDSLKLYDAALFHNRYYLYHGIAPALVLFLPFRLLTHRDLPENFASFLFCFAGYLFSAAALLQLIRSGPLRTSFLLLALGLTTGIPFLLNRTWVYEIAIAAGYCFSSAALCCLLGGMAVNSRRWFAAGGLACGLAIASRPHLGLFAVAFFALMLLRRPRALPAFLLPLLLAGLGIGLYNEQRFGNPTEFGMTYLLTGRNQNKVRPALANVAPESFYLLAAPPRTGPVFPWLRMAWPPAEISRPRDFYLEPSVGALWLAPFLPFILLLPGRPGPHRLLCLLFALASGGIFLFLASTGWSTQRYEVDFLPALVLVSLVCLAGLRNPLARTVATLLILGGISVNLAIAVGGPLDEMLRNRPDRFVRLSQLLTPLERYRLRLDAPFSLRCPVSGWRTLLSVGGTLFRYELVAEGERTLVSRRFDSEVRADVGEVREVEVRYAAGDLVVLSNGVERLRHRLGHLLTAPVDLEGACRP